MLNKTYFSISDSLNPLYLLDSWFNPVRFRTAINLNSRQLEVEWTKRADRALKRREKPLAVEMQLYFSCVVKKRVLFHDEFSSNAVKVNDNLYVAFRTVEPTSCDPIEFANNYPEKRELDSVGAQRMRAKRLVIDYKRSTWRGEFSI